MLLHITNLSKSFGAVDILRDITFTLNAGDRAGLVGANGAGKTTLLRVLVGAEVADSGAVTIGASVTLGYLPQSTPNFAGETIDDLIHESVGELRQLEARMRVLEAALASAEAVADATTSSALLEEYGQLAMRFQDRGGYDLDFRIGAVLDGLGLAYLPRDQAVRTLSGGEQTRVGLAALLLRAPDVLLLDEPTNHLDGASLAWLETYLASYSGAVLAVSHDRWFLNRTVNTIFAIDDRTHHLQRYAGNYDIFAQARAAEIAKWHEDYERQQIEIANLRLRMKETGRQVAHNRAPTDKDKNIYNAKGENVARAISRNVRAAQERLERIEADSIEKPPKPMRFQPQFRDQSLESRTVLTASGLTKRYGGRTVLHEVSFVVRPAARIALVGPNGAGKTTLLRILLGLEKPDDGQVRLVRGARIGYLPQAPTPTNPAATLLAAYRDGLVGPEGTIVASILGNGLFQLDDLPKTMGQLSLGQRRKLEIARLIAERPNILLLDEPANYLSFDVLESFETAILAFPGPAIIVSHDRWFIQHFGGEVWTLTDGVLTTQTS
ncbi:MAG: Bis-ABC ATPase YheS [Ktedonobacterales bacterium]|jgi:macrolide transport system ATP-binding/permease protein|nr:MAG: Bis-ABC ATPase YheS [Ktedonobacterales bacterium]